MNKLKNSNKKWEKNFSTKKSPMNKRDDRISRNPSGGRRKGYETVFR